MGKRSNFERNPRDYYPTPYSAVLPLIPHLEAGCKFSEPCAGDGRLSDHLVKNGMSVYWESDIEPQHERIYKHDAFTLTTPLSWADCIITNPPWDRHILHTMINHFKSLNNTWLLFDSDWAYTQQSSYLMQYCEKIVAVGRVSWMDNGIDGMDNCSWYLFKNNKCETTFHGIKSQTKDLFE